MAAITAAAWKVAYADFVTAMMAFFMVMWIIGMDESTKSAIEGYFQNPVGFSQGTGSNPISLNANPPPAPVKLPVQMVARQIEEQRYKDIGEKIQLELEGPEGLGDLAAQVEVVMTEQGLRIELVEGGDGEMFFGFGSSNLKPAAAKALRIIAAEIGASDASIVLEGHTDAAAFTTPNGYTNWELSADRANAARQAMERAGISPRRVAEVRGYADRHPRLKGDPYDKSNRRISILLPFSSPGAIQETESDESATGTPVGTS